MGNTCSEEPAPSLASHNVVTEPKIKEKYYNYLDEHLAKKEAELEEMKLQNARQQESINRNTQTINQYASQISQITEALRAKEAELHDQLRRFNNLQRDLENGGKIQTQLLVQMEAEKTKYGSVVTEMKITHKNEKDELQLEVSRLNRVINNSKADFENKFAAEIQQMQDRVTKVSKEIDKLSDPNRICLLKDVVAYGKVDYIHLNGKILMVNKLKNDNGKCLLSFKDSKYHICVHKDLAIKNIKLCVISDRIFYSNITKLCITDMKLTFDEYQEMVTSCNIQYLILRCITVKDKHGIVVDVSGLLKELPNIEKFTYIFKEGEILPIQKLIRLPSLSNSNNPSAFYELHLRCSAKFYDKIKAAEKDIVPPTFKLKIMKLKD